MICRASEDLGLELSISYVLGDQVLDMELAARIGAAGIWIRDPVTAQDDLSWQTTRVARDLWNAAQWIVGNSYRRDDLKGADF